MITATAKGISLKISNNFFQRNLTSCSVMKSNIQYNAWTKADVVTLKYISAELAAPVVEASIVGYHAMVYWWEAKSLLQWRVSGTQNLLHITAVVNITFLTNHNPYASSKALKIISLADKRINTGTQSSTLILPPVVCNASTLIKWLFWYCFYTTFNYQVLE
jgi:hypothetical protein